MSKKWLFWVTFSALCMAGCGDDSSKGGSGCGNWTVENGEVCDDGNTSDGDGCAADCMRVEEGYECPSTGGSCFIPEPIDPDKPRCGNGKVENKEVCDDGNNKDADGCSADCSAIEAGYDCPPEGGSCTSGKPSKCPDGEMGEDGTCHKVGILCGNGEIDEDEACDDGNTEGGDGCAADCSEVEAGFSCDFPGMECIPEGCGNNVVDEGEECDAGTLSAPYGPGECTESCKTAHYCGDGLLDDIDVANGEECDDGLDSSEYYNGCSTECKLVNYCGDGMVQPDNEQCDDGNKDDGDGCSAKCEIEPNYVCVASEGKSVCSSILCGNGVLDGAEACDDGNRNPGDGCSMICQVERHWRCTLEGGKSKCVDTCGNGTLDSDTGEFCDDNNPKDGDGCSAECTVESGYTCDGAVCFARACGDGIIAGSEECDDGNAVSDDGCSKFCKRETGWHCDTPGADCAKDVCGDGKITGDETCDEGTIANPSGGCVQCQVQMGWKCPKGGVACEEAKCGDGVVEGAETCEGGGECCEACVLQKSCHCDEDKMNCVKGKCGDGTLDEGEECDDDNKEAGDGCSPECTREAIFDCDANGCKAVCGDGITLVDAGEECDDGNLVNGDGCSSQCKVETGYSCTPPYKEIPQQINLPMVCRDVMRYNNHSVAEDTSPMTDGYVSKELYNSLPDSCKGVDNGYRWRNPLLIGHPNPDFMCITNATCEGVVAEELDIDNTPSLMPPSNIKTLSVSNGNSCLDLYTCPEVFKWWYKDMPGLNRTLNRSLLLNREGNENVYKYSSSYFYPIGVDEGYGKEGSNGERNGEFSCTIQTYFRFDAKNEELTFAGDDDVWVFFNRRLAIEVAGIHGAWRKTVTLTEEVAKEKFHMYAGGIYPIHMFHAERCTGESSFELTLTGFVQMGDSNCTTVCGDGLVRGAEECDPIAFADPANPTADELEQAKIKGCIACKQVSYCGNGVLEKGEQCDNTEAWCKECMLSDSTCGDNKKEGHEECDGTDGVTGDQICLDNCRISGCGDGILSGDEQCDDGNLLDDDMCTSKCKLPTCGDGIVSSAIGEVCDDGINDGSYGGCGIGCTYMPPRCGDGIVNTAEGEECDNGDDANVGGYGGCKAGCKLDIHCGDHIVQPEFEQCDEGKDNGAGTCTQSCVFVIN
ncbi:MAG: DUF4215 domain-containing protein [Proteobacteria bacterium]|nr:DUF4215 domain-containing protein [Pseudomonadota bacterium]